MFDEPTIDEPTAEQLALGRAFEEVVTWVRRSRTGGDVSATALSLLDRLDTDGPQRVTALAALEGVTQPATTALVNRLAERGWVQRDEDPADGRASLVRLVDAGRARLHRHRAERSRRLADHLAELDAADQAALLAALPALRHLTAARVRPVVQEPVDA